MFSRDSHGFHPDFRDPLSEFEIRNHVLICQSWQWPMSQNRRRTDPYMKHPKPRFLSASNGFLPWFPDHLTTAYIHGIVPNLLEDSWKKIQTVLGMCPNVRWCACLFRFVCCHFIWLKGMVQNHYKTVVTLPTWVWKKTEHTLDCCWHYFFKKKHIALNNSRPAICLFGDWKQLNKL